MRLSDLFDGSVATSGNAPHPKTRGSARRAAVTKPRTGEDEPLPRRGRRAGSNVADGASPGLDAEAPTPAVARGDDTAGGAAYEPLFGTDRDTRKRRQRPAKPPATATQRALGLLTRREHSRKELTRKLIARGVDADEVSAAVDKLAGAGWQDDRRFAESLVRARASMGYGPLHIRAELGTHDLPADVRDDALDAFEGGWHEIAADIARRRFGRIDDARTRERKAADYLVRRGFPSEIARAASRFDPSCT